MSAEMKIAAVEVEAGRLVAVQSRQGTALDLDSLVTMYGTRALDEFEFIARREEYADKDHVLFFLPVAHEQQSDKLGYFVAGGVEIHHLGCCPGDGGVGNRLDSNVFLEHVHIGPRETSPVQFPAAESQVGNGWR